MNGTRQYESNGMPLLIPQDYHGEFLREHRAVQLPVQSDEAAPYAEALTEAPTAMTAPSVDKDEMPVTDDGQFLTRSADRSESGSLLDGLYHLLIGETGAEEETLLLLAIALLLLWGHLDRGDLFDRSTWDSDDLGLLLVGYLLLS